MQPEVTHEAQMRAARQLALHLRQNPEDAKKDPQELAAQFGLPATFVTNVLSGIQGPTRRDVSWLTKIDLSFIKRFFQAGRRLWDRATERPTVFILITSLIFALVLVFSGEGNGEIKIGGRESRIGSDNPLVTAIFFLILGLHFACYYRRRMVRYALHGGLALWVSLSILFMTTNWLGMRTNAEGIKAGLLLLISAAMFVICLIYAGLGSAAAILGAYFRLRSQARKEDRMSRQDLLEQYFELQERLDRSEGLAPKPTIFDSDFVKVLLTTGPLWALLTGLVLSTFAVVISLVSGIDVSNSQDPNWAHLVMMALSLIAFLSYIAAGFFARSPWWGVISSIALSVGGLPPALIGIHFFHLEFLKDEYEIASFTVSTFLYVIVTLFGVLGGIVQRRAAREFNLARNEPAAILAEMVRIQWRLSDRTNQVCVMVVDAAKSSEMKSFADPLAVEYSFREYQSLLEDLSSTLQGRVHSTAGDGAVIAFGSAAEAFTASKRIQTDIERFNRENNRLQLPFRLRIGLHMGEVVGDLDEVEFTEVIDIAAHVQAAAPVGGIAVTERVAEHLPTEEFVPLARQVDGQNVLLALNPLVDKPWQTYTT